jgi:hypothetical protein
MPANCKVPGCNWKTNIPSRHISGCLATWHVYEKHYDVWVRVIGECPPIDPDVRTAEGLAQAVIEEALCGY